MSNAIKLDYTNYKGVKSRRKIIPIKLEYKSTEYHSEIQWLLIGFDIDKQDIRSFAVKDIHFPVYMSKKWKAKTPTLDRPWNYRLLTLLEILNSSCNIFDNEILQLKESIGIFKARY